MSFDKIKAMRNAEQFLAQGKIRDAITEYKAVVTNDPRDFVTLNLLGDLYVKNSDKKEAVKCFTVVADHYGSQGFAQKAIAIYNKIARLDPHSIEVSAKLAELYRSRGAVAEARTHYLRVAEHLQKKGQKIEALDIWKQIAQLDQSNTEVYLNLANSYLEENETDAAVEAFTNAAGRFTKAGRHDAALEALEKALEIKPCDSAALNAFVEAKFATGAAAEASDRLTSLLETNPHDRDLLQLLVACRIEAGEIAEAEKSVVRLVELEPSSYPLLLDIARIYLDGGDSEAASRLLSMTSEHLLVGGNSDEFRGLVNGILEKDPEQLEALRLLTRFCAWQKDEAAFRDSLERLTARAVAVGSLEDERYALSQLVMILPHEIKYADRLREVNEQLGYEPDEVVECLFDKRFLKDDETEAQEVSFAFASDLPDGAFAAVTPGGDFYPAEFEFAEIAAQNGHTNVTDAEIDADEAGGAIEAGGADLNDDRKLANEIDSIKFYIESGYVELAEKAINELHGEFGDRPEIDELRAFLGGHLSVGSAGSDPTFTEAQADLETARAFELDDLRAELGLEDSEPVVEGDYETHYHTAIAYQEMGLMDDAIKEFQDAVSLVSPDDGTRRFFQCANLLGHCFMQKGMPHLAVTWFQRSLEAPTLSDDEKQGTWYELAAAYEADGDLENAGRYFEQVYAENIDFRDVSERMKNIAVHH